MNEATTDDYAAVKKFFLFLGCLAVVGGIIRAAVKDPDESFFFEKASHKNRLGDFQKSLDKLTDESFSKGMK